MKPKLGFIGLGIMGRPMASHLVEAGYELFVYDHHPESIQELVGKGATACTGCCEVASKSDVIISMVSDSPNVEELALGEDGIILAAREGMVHIDMSTIAPAVAVKVARVLGEKGMRCLDAPVSGGEKGAIDGSLSIMVGGPRDLFDEMLPIFELMGKTITYCGANGAGQTVKVCNQIQTAVVLMGMAESLVLGTKAGVDPAIILKVLGGGYAQTRIMDVRGPNVIKGNFEPGFKSRLHFKDLNIVMDTARELQVPLPAASVAHELFSAMMAAGKGELDHSAIIQIIEDLAGVQARSKSVEK